MVPHDRSRREVIKVSLVATGNALEDHISDKRMIPKNLSEKPFNFLKESYPL
jgi:hypothetical protein